ncbi:MFS transporter [Devosia alba]|uniref:MFS transporter n=1 Tax=Devosia alba TaxID=3152360 RepID=UPI003267CBE7
MSLPLFALFLAAFAFGTAEFVIAGVLPEVAGGLNVTIPVAGYLVSGYAVGIAIGGPLLAVTTKKISRKALIIALGAVFTLGQVLCALAPNFELLMAARVIVSVAHGTYFGIAAIVAVGLVPRDKRGFAVALILSGLTVSNILGVPGGTAIGNALGWRATFWAVGALGLLATLIIAIALPRTAGAAATSGSFRREFRALGRQQIITSLIIVMLVMIGQYSLFTYIAPLLRDVTGLDVNMVPWVLLLYGVGSTIGVFIGGRLADWKLMPSLIAILGLQVVAFTALYLVSPYPIAMAITVVLWGGVNFAFGSPVQTRILAWAADAPNLASSLIPSGFNVGIAIGAVLGAAAIENGLGYRALPLIGTVALILAVAVAIYSHLREQRSNATPPGLTGAVAAQ